MRQPELPIGAVTPITWTTNCMGELDFLSNSNCGLSDAFTATLRWASWHSKEVIVDHSTRGGTSP